MHSKRKLIYSQLFDRFNTQSPRAERNMLRLGGFLCCYQYAMQETLPLKSLTYILSFSTAGEPNIGAPVSIVFSVSPSGETVNIFPLEAAIRMLPTMSAVTATSARSAAMSATVTMPSAPLCGSLLTAKSGVCIYLCT